MTLIFGRPRYFVPISILHRHPRGFHGGPAGYQEIRDKAEAERRGVIVIVEGEPKLLTAEE